MAGSYLFQYVQKHCCLDKIEPSLRADNADRLKQKKTINIMHADQTHRSQVHYMQDY